MPRARCARARLDVAHIAQRWGFVHPGRFSRAYRAAYGRFPSETLREGNTGPR